MKYDWLILKTYWIISLFNELFYQSISPIKVSGRILKSDWLSCTSSQGKLLPNGSMQSKARYTQKDNRAVFVLNFSLSSSASMVTTRSAHVIVNAVNNTTWCLCLWFAVTHGSSKTTGYRVRGGAFVHSLKLLSGVCVNLLRMLILVIYIGSISDFEAKRMMVSS